MYRNLLKWSGIIGISVLVVLIAGMLYYSSKKPLVYVHAEEQNMADEDQTDEGPMRLVLVKPEEQKNQSRFFIPVSNLTTQESIYIENDLMNRQVTITVTGMDASFYDNQIMYGNLQGIRSVEIGTKGENLIILLTMDSVYEYEAVLENQKLGLTFFRPADRYDKIVVLDAGHGGEDPGIQENGVTEAEIVLDIAERVKAKLESEGVKVYMTRTAEETVDESGRAAFANEIGADAFISFHLAEGTVYGVNAYYNDVYYIPELTNATLANALVVYTVSAVNGRGNGIFPAAQEENEMLFGIYVPAARLELGCPGNIKEAELLKRDDYREDLAEGICQAIIACLENEN